MRKRTRLLLTETILTVHELSRYTGIKPAALKQQAARGRIPYIKKGVQLLFDRRDFKPKPHVTRSQPSTPGRQSAVS
jgi:hypothetical protein